MSVSPSKEKTSLASSTSSPWWTYPYVWMILLGPALVVVAALWTGYIAHQGADPVMSAQSPLPTLSAAQIEKNHATTRQPLSPPLSLEQQTATHLGDRHE